MYNLCNYLTYQCLFFFPNNVGSYSPRFNHSIYDPTYLPWFYVVFWFWQPIIYILMECITYIIIPCHIYSYFVRPSVMSNFFMEGITYIYIPCYIYSCGAKGSKDSGPFHIRPKAYTEEEELPEDEWRESRLLGYTVEDDPVLGRPKSQKGKAPHCQRQSPRGSQRRFRAQWFSHRSMVEKQPQEKLSISY